MGEGHDTRKPKGEMEGTVNDGTLAFPWDWFSTHSLQDENSLRSNNHIKASNSIDQHEVSSQTESSLLQTSRIRCPISSTWIPLGCFKISLFKTLPLTSNLCLFYLVPSVLTTALLCPMVMLKDNFCLHGV